MERRLRMDGWGKGGWPLLSLSFIRTFSRAAVLGAIMRRRSASRGFMSGCECEKESELVEKVEKGAKEEARGDFELALLHSPRAVCVCVNARSVSLGELRYSHRSSQPPSRLRRLSAARLGRRGHASAVLPSPSFSIHSLTPCRPRQKTKVLGPLLDSGPSGRWVRFLRCKSGERREKSVSGGGRKRVFFSPLSLRALSLSLDVWLRAGAGVRGARASVNSRAWCGPSRMCGEEEARRGKGRVRRAFPTLPTARLTSFILLSSWESVRGTGFETGRRAPWRPRLCDATRSGYPPAAARRSQTCRPGRARRAKRERSNRAGAAAVPAPLSPPPACRAHARVQRPAHPEPGLSHASYSPLLIPSQSRPRVDAFLLSLLQNTLPSSLPLSRSGHKTQLSSTMLIPKKNRRDVYKHLFKGARKERESVLGAGVLFFRGAGAGGRSTGAAPLSSRLSLAPRSPTLASSTLLPFSQRASCSRRRTSRWPSTRRSRACPTCR